MPPSLSFWLEPKSFWRFGGQIWPNLKRSSRHVASVESWINFNCRTKFRIFHANAKFLGLF